MIFIEIEDLFKIVDGVKQQVVAKVYAPERVSPEEWKCRAELTNISGPLDKKVHGIDSLQAMSLAIGLLNYMLLESDELKKGQLHLKDRLAKSDDFVYGKLDATFFKSLDFTASE